jgi:hypothetical protein
MKQGACFQSNMTEQLDHQEAKQQELMKMLHQTYLKNDKDGSQVNDQDTKEDLLCVVYKLRMCSQ